MHANPFRDHAELSLHVTRAGDVMIEILDIHGRLVRQWSWEDVSPGDHPLIWDGRAGSGAESATGVYLVRARQHGRAAVARVLRIR
jgi:flagellar hook assembly protein FlgD